jgi:hypothetical protein
MEQKRAGKRRGRVMGPQAKGNTLLDFAGGGT